MIWSWGQEPKTIKEEIKINEEEIINRTINNEKKYHLNKVLYAFWYVLKCNKYDRKEKRKPT